MEQNTLQTAKMKRRLSDKQIVKQAVKAYREFREAHNYAYTTSFVSVNDEREALRVLREKRFLAEDLSAEVIARGLMAEYDAALSAPVPVYQQRGS